MKLECLRGWNLVGDPIDVVSGANVDRARDFAIEGPFPFRFYRYYDSRWNDEDRGLGVGHRHELDEWLVFDLDGVTHRSPAGYETYFSHVTTDGERVSAVGRTLERIDERTYRLSEHACPVRLFHRPPGAREARLVELARTSDGVTHRISLHHDERGRLQSILAPLDETLRLEWEGAHIVAIRHRRNDGESKALIRYRYDARSCLVEGIDAYQQSFELAYDEERRVRQRTDRRGYSFYFEHDGEGRCVRSWGEDGVLAVQLTYRPMAFETRVLDANGGEWVYQYLPNGVLTFITDPYGGVRHFRVAPDGRVLAEVDEKGAETTYRFDGAGAPIAKVTPNGDVISLPADEDAPRPGAHRVPGIPIEWELGDAWELDFRLPDAHELPFDVPGAVREALVTSEDWRRGTLEVVRDEQGLRLREELEDGRARTYGYNENGGFRRMTDLDGGTWKLEHASWNHIVAEVDPLGNRTTFEHSPTEKVTAVVDPASVRTDYAYDLKDRLVEVRRGGPVREKYAYDLAGNLTEKRSSRGELLLAMAYDQKGRITKRTLASGEEHTFRYDARGRYVAAETLKHKCSFGYDWAGRRTEDKRDGKGVEHRFDGEKLVRTRALERFVTEYSHVAGGTMVIVDPSGGTHRLRRHGRGVFTRDLACGLSETVQYHPRGGRVTSKTLWDAGGVRWQRRYRYSGEGDLLEVLDSDRGRTGYTHDAAHRLVGAEHADGRIERYEHNAAGSLFRSPTLEGTVGELNRLRYANGDRLEYDERHHVKERAGAQGTWSYDRDSRDQLTGVFWQSPDGKRWGWDAEYDPLGRRIRKSPGYREDHQYYWDTDRLAAEVLPDGRVRVYVYVDAFAMVPLLFLEYTSVHADLESGKRYYVLTDQRGCPERILDDAGEIVWKARIDPYGYARVEIGADFHQPLRFPGHFADPEIGLHYNRFRYYSPELGRYLESDPVGLGGGMNPYRYASNPLTRVDARGLCPDGDPPGDSGSNHEDPAARETATSPTNIPSDPSSTPRPKYLDTCPLGPEYRGEENGESQRFAGQRVRYLTDGERQRRLLTVGNDGLLYQNGQPLDTGDTGGIYAMDANGNVFVSTEQRAGEFHHSSLLAGENAAAAGEIHVAGGIVTHIDGESGHYKPSDTHTDQAVAELRERGANVPNSVVH